MPVTPGAIGPDLFQRKVATPYSGPPVAPPVATTLPPPVVTPPPPTPTTGGVVGGGQPTGRALNPIDNSYNYTQTTGSGAPRNTGAVPGNPIDTSYNYTQTIGRGSPRETGAVPGTLMDTPNTGRGSPRETGAVPSAGTVNPNYANQAGIKALGLTPKTPTAPKLTGLPTQAQTQATVRAKLGLAPKAPVKSPPVALPVKTSPFSKLRPGGR
jgi:hypothetical protein